MSVMTKAMTPQQHVFSQLRGLANGVLDAAVPDAAVAIEFNALRFDLEIFDLQCQYDVFEPWPADEITEQLHAWRYDLVLQRIDTGISYAMRQFAVFADAAGIAAGAIDEFGEVLRTGLAEWAREEWWKAS